MDTDIETDSRSYSKEASWRAHATLLCSGNRNSVGGASCQSRFASSKTAVPLFREEAKSACHAVENGSGIVTLAKTDGNDALKTERRATTTPAVGRRCRDNVVNAEGGEGGTWRYCFEEMKWVLGPGSDMDGREETGRTRMEDMTLAQALERIQVLEDLLKRHGISTYLV